VPAYDAEQSLAAVIEELRAALPELEEDAILVVDDGSRDATAEVARKGRARVVSHVANRGKGAALETGLTLAHALGYDVALTVDADGQHPGASARAVLEASSDPRALVLGVRNLARDGAPRKNQLSNGISNFFLSRFTARPLQDTQCGLRRYPVKETLALGLRARGYALEAEVILRALAKGIPLVQTEIAVRYPPEKERVTHFHAAKDPARIIVTVLRTLWELRAERP